LLPAILYIKLIKLLACEEADGVAYLDLHLVSDLWEIQRSAGLEDDNSGVHELCIG